MPEAAEIGCLVTAAQAPEPSFQRANARSETKALGVPSANMEDLSFDVLDFMEYALPWEMRVDP